MSKSTILVGITALARNDGMDDAERLFQKEVDAMILEASPEDLSRFQEIDLALQLLGGSFYDAFLDRRRGCGGGNNTDMLASPARGDSRKKNAP